MLQVYQFHPIVLFYWLVAFSIWEWMFVAGSLKLAASKVYREYYTQLPAWVPITGDFLYSTLIFLTAQWIYAWLAGMGVGGSLPPMVVFVLAFLGTQWVYDLTYGFLVSRLPSTTSKYIDYFQRYIKDFGFLAAIGDSLYGLVWIALTWLLLRYVPLSVALYLLIAAAFLWMVVKW